MLIQPKRWVMPTAGALFVLLILITLWGRSNPERIDYLAHKMPAWPLYSPGTAKNAPPPFAGGDIPIKAPETTIGVQAQGTNGPEIDLAAEPVVHLDQGDMLDHIVGSTATTTDVPPIARPPAVETTRAPLQGGLGNAGLKAPPVGAATTAPAVGLGQAPGQAAAKPPAQDLRIPGGTGSDDILRPMKLPPPPPFDPNAVVISDGYPDNGTHNVLRSISGKDGKYFVVDFWGLKCYNPNLIPHPRYPGTWMVTTQTWKSGDDNQAWFTQLVCDAVWENGTLVCKKSPLILPVSASESEKCTGNLVYFNLNVGPHDARAFYGPEVPYLVYGTQSAYTCFGQFIQDFRLLTDWGLVGNDPFRHGTDLQRPDSYGPVEKNWFVWWDSNNEMYLHYDVKPHRVFAKVAADGSVGKDLGLVTRQHDDECLARHTANVEESVRESLHQATNSLRVTMCRRADPKCVATNENTFILSIFQQKSFNDFHGIYEPYVMLFHQTPPFQTYAFSKLPIWTMGRNMPGERSVYREIPKDQSEMVYLTSLNWMQEGLHYHGYLDDIIFVGFGVEDSIPAVIDCTAEALIGEIMKC